MTSKTSNKTEILIRLTDINKSFGTTHVLKDVSLEVARAEVVVIIGPSGGGKSTLLRTINLLGPPDSGEVWVDGFTIFSAGPDKKKIKVSREDLRRVAREYLREDNRTVVTLKPVSPEESQTLGVLA